MPCKQARRDVSVDRLETVSIFKERSVRAVADDNNLDIDAKAVCSNLRRRRCRIEESAPPMNVSGRFGW